jgi:uncharacterized protein
VVITHRVRDGQHAAYEEWLAGIGRACRTYPGHLDWQIFRPLVGLSTSYTVVIRFDQAAHLKQWMESVDRAEWIARAAPMLAQDDDYSIHSGLDFWFLPQGAKVKIPVRWKQFLITWSAIFPLGLAVPLIVIPIMRRLGLADVRPLTTFVTTGIIVALMVYVVMPRYTRLVRRWLSQ